MTGLILIVFVTVDWFIWKHYRQWKFKMYDKYVRDIIKHLMSFVPDKDSRGWVKYVPVMFCALISIVIVMLVSNTHNRTVTYENPDFIGIARDFGNSKYKLCNIRTQDCFKVNSCGTTKDKWFAGHVMYKLSYVDAGNCQLIDLKDPFKILRQDPVSRSYIDWKKLHGDLTYDDGYARPVIANNCHNIKNDTQTECVGGEAFFSAKDQIKENINARSAGWNFLNTSSNY